MRICRINNRACWAPVLLLLGLFCPLAATEPPLARLSFWVSPERMDEFEAAYGEQVVPSLKRHGLVESSRRGRTTADSVFSRLFEVKAPADIAAKSEVLQKDPAWQEVLRRLGSAFGKAGSDDFIRFHLGHYKTSAGPGKTVEAGPGSRQGLWQSFGVRDGLPVSVIWDMLQDREGNLWFGTERGGVSRYDGTEFITFTVADGLAANTIGSPPKMAWRTIEWG